MPPKFILKPEAKPFDHLPFDLLKSSHQSGEIRVGPESMMKYRKDNGIPNIEFRSRTREPMGHRLRVEAEVKDRIGSVKNKF